MHKLDSNSGISCRRVGDLHRVARRCCLASEPIGNPPPLYSGEGIGEGFLNRLFIAGIRLVVNCLSHPPTRLNVPPRMVGAYETRVQFQSIALSSLHLCLVAALQHPPYYSQAKTQAILPAKLHANLQADLPPP
jgi:hypothetical protein